MTADSVEHDEEDLAALFGVRGRSETLEAQRILRAHEVNFVFISGLIPDPAKPELEVGRLTYRGLDRIREYVAGLSETT